MVTVTSDIANIKIAYPGLGKKIKFYRKRLGYTQGKLGDLLGLSWMTVHRWERDQRGVKLSMLEKVSQVLDTNLKDLMTYTNAEV